MRRTLAVVALLLVFVVTASAQMVWDWAASFAYPGYLAIPSSPALQFSGSISVECWVNAPNVSTSGDQGLLCKYSTPGTGFALALRSGRILFEIGGSPVFLGKAVLPMVSGPTLRWCTIHRRRRSQATSTAILTQCVQM